MIRTATIGIAVSTFLATLAAQTQVTIGGPGTKGLQGASDPPTLSDGSNATATLTYRYAPATGRLEVDVANTTPQVVGETNPVITQVYFNVPQGAVTGIGFVAQSTTGSVQPEFTAAIDADYLNSPNGNHVGGFGLFHVALTTNNRRGIANPAATNWGVPTANLVMGTATFAFDVTGPGAAQLTDADFAAAPSWIPPGSTVVTAACKFQAGGTNDGSGFIGTRKGCVPGLWLDGAPCIGNTVHLVAANEPGCHNCLTASLDPTPFPLPPLGITLPASPPYVVIHSQDAASPLTFVPLFIPNIPGLVGQPVVILNLSFGPGTSPFAISDTLAFTICN
ncbi:MAG: hypothetical protein IPK26_01570 [Planctomycetes bacterium]|nr:hypothetical protein [Planctomycetota bacterium]